MGSPPGHHALSRRRSRLQGDGRRSGRRWPTAYRRRTGAATLPGVDADIAVQEAADELLDALGRDARADLRAERPGAAPRHPTSTQGFDDNRRVKRRPRHRRSYKLFCNLLGSIRCCLKEILAHDKGFRPKADQPTAAVFAQVSELNKRIDEAKDGRFVDPVIWEISDRLRVEWSRSKRLSISRPFRSSWRNIYHFHDAQRISVSIIVPLLALHMAIVNQSERLDIGD